MHKIKLSLDIESSDSTVFDIITSVNAALNQLRDRKAIKRMTGAMTMALEGRVVTLDSYMFSRDETPATEIPAVRRYAPRKGTAKARAHREQIRTSRIERATRMQAMGAAANKAKADEEARRVGPRIDEAMRRGESVVAIADALNKEGLRTRQGNLFTHLNVPPMHSRYIRLLDAETAPMVETPTSSETYAATVNF